MICDIPITLLPMNPEYHKHGKFREQIAVFYKGHITDDEIYLLRSYQQVCLPGAASFDPERPGADSAASWEYINNLLEKEACGTFHTHPFAVDDFSGQDWASMKAFAWHSASDICSTEYNR